MFSTRSPTSLFNPTLTLTLNPTTADHPAGAHRESSRSQAVDQRARLESRGTARPWLRRGVLHLHAQKQFVAYLPGSFHTFQGGFHGSFRTYHGSIRASMEAFTIAMIVCETVCMKGLLALRQSEVGQLSVYLRYPVAMARANKRLVRGNTRDKRR